MNSEIINASKLSSVTVVTAPSKQAQDKVPAYKQNETEAIKLPSSQTDSQVIGTDKSNVDSSKKATPSSDDIKKAIEEGNSLLQVTKRNLQFKVDDATDELIIKVVDSDSGELVRQIPSEEVLDFVRRMQEIDGQQGWLHQDRA